MFHPPYQPRQIPDIPGDSTERPPPFQTFPDTYEQAATPSAPSATHTFQAHPSMSEIEMQGRNHRVTIALENP